MTTMTKVRSAAPVAPWLGGKKALHAKIIERIEAIPHSTYAEPFVGSRTQNTVCSLMLSEGQAKSRNSRVLPPIDAHSLDMEELDKPATLIVK